MECFVLFGKCCQLQFADEGILQFGIVFFFAKGEALIHLEIFRLTRLPNMHFHNTMGDSDHTAPKLTTSIRLVLQLQIAQLTHPSCNDLALPFGNDVFLF